MKPSSVKEATESHLIKIHFPTKNSEALFPVFAMEHATQFIYGNRNSIPYFLRAMSMEASIKDGMWLERFFNEANGFGLYCYVH